MYQDCPQNPREHCRSETFFRRVGFEILRDVFSCDGVFPSVTYRHAAGKSTLEFMHTVWPWPRGPHLDKTGVEPLTRTVSLMRCRSI